MAAKANRKSKRPRAREVKEILDLLHHGLSDEEVQQVLAGALLALDNPGLDRLTVGLAKETGSTLRALLSSRAGKGKPKTREPARPRAGSAKVHQEWERAWRDWNACVFETSDEDGRYVCQEHHWEPSYLDLTALAEDLEPIARRMKELLPRVFEENLATGFSFADTLREMDREIGSGLPDWMDESWSDGCPLGPEATGCLLAWEWRSARRDGGDAFTFANRLCHLDAETGKLFIDDDTVIQFVLDLDPSDLTALFRGITKHAAAEPWKQVLESVHSAWFAIHQEICRREDPAHHLETCRRNIARDWRLALPVVKDLLGRKAWDEVLAVVGDAVRALLPLRDGETWDPAETLLACRPGMRFRDRRGIPVDELLAAWRKAVRGLGQDETACALELQRLTWRKWADGDAVLAAFEKASSRGYPEMAERLYVDWRTLVVEESLGYHRSHLVGHPHRAPGTTWVHALVDAARAGKGGGATFRKAVRRWLQEINQTPDTLHEARDTLALLTLEADPDNELRRASRRLDKLLRTPGWKGDPALHATRRRWLKRLGGVELFPEVLHFWKQNAVHLLPDPGRAPGANYVACAAWLAAIHELDPRCCQHIVREWRATHHRKRNLWKAIATEGLPLAMHADRSRAAG